LVAAATGLAALVAWVGASLIVLSDGRRGLALGVALAAVGLAAIAWRSGGPVAAGAIAVGGVAAAAGRLRSGEPGWGIMPAGSTPRLLLCVAAALVAVWVATTVATGPGAGLRFAALATLGLAAARILWSANVAVLLTASGLLALDIGVAAGAIDVWQYIAGGLVAAAIGWVPPRTSPRVV
jgi:hypothetical protein